MATATKKVPRKAPQYARVSDLINRLGDIDPMRIYWTPMPGTATERDALFVVERKIGRCELVERTLVEKPEMGIEEAFLADDLAMILGAFVRKNRLGRVFGSQGLTRMIGGNIRVPDVGFVDREQYRAWRRNRIPVLNSAPALAVEVLSRSNSRAEMAQKRREYFASGSRMVWEIDPRRKTVAVYTSPTKRTMLTEPDTLDGGDVIPGFTLPLTELFEDRMSDL